jgi:hypothetical protein
MLWLIRMLGFFWGPIKFCVHCVKFVCIEEILLINAIDFDLRLS